MATKQQVMDLHRANPTWTAPDIAASLGCLDAYVRATARRYGMDLPKAKATPTTVEMRARKAAVPMLAALKHLTHAARTSGGRPGPDIVLRHACEDAEAVIAQAEGAVQ